MLAECLEQSNLKPQHTLVDATLGGAGHSLEMAKRLGAGPNEDFNPVRTPAPLLAMMDDESKARLIAENPLYGVPVCRCCHVSEGELVEALHRAIPVKSLDALKWRTGATMGPCHGGRCTARILEMIEEVQRKKERK